MRFDLDETQTTNRDDDLAERSNPASVWWDIIKFACWVSGAMVLYQNLNWGEPNEIPWLRLKSALAIKPSLFAFAFFTLAVWVHRRSEK